MSTPPPMSNPPPPVIATPPPALPPPPPSNASQSPPPSPPTTSPPPPVGDAPPPPPPPSPSSDSPPPPFPPSITPPPPTNPQSPSPPQPPNSPPPTGEPPPPNPPQSSPPPPIPFPSPSAPFVPPSSPPSSTSPSPSPPALTPPSITPPISSSPPPPIRVPPPHPSILRPPPPPLPSPSNRSSAPAGVVIAVALGLLLLGIFGAVAFCIRKRRKKRSGTNGDYIVPTTGSSSQGSGSYMLKMHDYHLSSSISGNGSGNIINYSPYEHGSFRHSRLWFTYEDLVDATNGFSAGNLLGEGGFGPVYKGILVDGREVAVKKLKVDGGQGDREFRAEVEIISRVHHRHLVSLVGYCVFEETRILVYDYLPNDTLYFHLHGEGTPVMDWATRVKIAVGAARGLAYLHEDCHPRIIHRDIKSSNILLDKNFEARVSDFGLAKLALDTNTHITTRVMGTFGYMAPEYASTGKLTEKSDVYSFGVVLLELISGRKPVDTSQPTGEESLVEWARPRLNHALEMEGFGELPDPKLDGNYAADEMFRIIEAAAACVRQSSVKRPAMGQVARALDSMSTSDLTNGMRVGESEILNPPLQSGVIRLFHRMAHGSSSYSTDTFSQFSQDPHQP